MPSRFLLPVVRRGMPSPFLLPIGTRQRRRTVGRGQDEVAELPFASSPFLTTQQEVCRRHCPPPAPGTLSLQVEAVVHPGSPSHFLPSSGHLQGERRLRLAHLQGRAPRGFLIHRRAQGVLFMYWLLRMDLRGASSSGQHPLVSHIPGTPSPYRPSHHGFPMPGSSLQHPVAVRHRPLHQHHQASSQSSKDVVVAVVRWCG